MPLAPLVLLDQLGHQGLLGQVVHLAPQDLLDPEETEENQVPLGLQENQGAQDHQGHLGLLDLEVQRAHLVSQVVLDPVGHLAHPDQGVRQDHQDLEVREERLGHRDPLAQRVPQESLVKQDPQVLQGMAGKQREGSLVLLVLLVHQEARVDQGQLVREVIVVREVNLEHLESGVVLVHLVRQGLVDSLDQVGLVEKEVSLVFQVHQDLVVI